jgi:hypothetical protein
MIDSSITPHSTKTKHCHLCYRTIHKHSQVSYCNGVVCCRQAAMTSNFIHAISLFLYTIIYLLHFFHILPINILWFNHYMKLRLF